MTDLGKTIIKGKMRIVTPVHIGGAQEKHLQQGLDYISEGSKIYFLDEKKILSHFDITQYSNALAINKLSILLTNSGKSLEEFSSNVVWINGEIGSEIKVNIKNALSNKPILPGTSIKGAIRSVFYNVVVGGDPPWNSDCGPVTWDG